MTIRESADKAHPFLIAKTALVRFTMSEMATQRFHGPTRIERVRRCWAVWGVLVFLALAGRPCGRARAAEVVDFNQKIRPILSDHCFKCHGPDAETRKAKLRLDVRDEAIRERDGVFPILPGKPESSELIRRIRATDPDDVMPPPETGMQLSEQEKSLLTDWIASGAAYEMHWAFRPIHKPPTPIVQHGERLQTPIDAYLLARLEKEGLTFAAEADREKLIRRVTFDLTGLPPTIQEIDAFLADQAPNAYERLVDELLKRSTYGERMASEWLDVARYSDSYGYQVDRDRFVWPWRDWVIQAFNENLPYDQFIIWQLAGDLLPEATDEQILATTFCRLNPQKVEGGSVPEEFRVEYVADRTITFGTAFLGLTLECARCHDHKYDPIKQKEYYQLTSFFANIDEAGLYSYFTESIPTPTLALASNDQKQRLARLQTENRRAETTLDSVAVQSEKTFAEWLMNRPPVPALPGCLGRFEFEDKAGGALVNAMDDKTPASSPEANPLVPGRGGQVLQLSGDDEVTFKFGNFRRFDPFTISLWIKTPDVKERAVIVHRSRAWTDAGSRGYEFMIEEGKLTASLIHFWPGNAIGVRTREMIPANTWMHVAMTYDGSSRASGLRIHVNGHPAECEVVRNHLTKTITGGGNDHIIIGARFRDRGFTGGQVDDFQVFDRELTPPEIAQLHDGYYLADLLRRPMDSLTDAERQALRAYYLAVEDAPYREQLAKLREARKQTAELEDGLQEIMVMRERPEPLQSYFLKRGAYDARGEKVVSDTPAALPSLPQGAAHNRLALARWLVSPEQPLTARVTVNRYWQMFFGQGLVRTANDFGSQGTPPTHPELLDWLAADFIEHGWDLKRLVRGLVTSSAYRQSANAAPEVLAQDPDNHWLGRGPRYRWPAEMIRDNALFVSGLLVPRIGGPPAKPYEVSVSFSPVAADKGDGLYRRSLYTYWKRTGPAPVMMALDAAKRDVCSVRRETTATPIQAFVFMNDPQFVEAARKVAEKTLLEHELNSTAAIREMFRLLLGRRPNDREMEALQRLYLEQQSDFAAHPEEALALLKTGNSDRDERIEPTSLAAAAVVASTLLSHDECVMKR